MKEIKIIDGCTSSNIIVDGISIADMKDDQIKKIILNILDGVRYYIENDTPYKIWPGKNQLLKEIITLIVEDDYNSLGYCEQCGDDVFETIWRI